MDVKGVKEKVDDVEGMKDGTFIVIEYTGRIAGTGEIFDLTDEEVAKENRIHNPNTKYGPVTIIIGRNMILKSLEDAVRKMKLKEKRKIVLEPGEAFGMRDPKLMKVFSLAYFRKQKIAPLVGQIITLGDSISGKVLSVSAGRVKIDFNHQLAGKTLEYEVKVKKEITDTKEKVSSMVCSMLGCGEKEVKVSVTGEKATIDIPNGEKIPNDAKSKISESIKKNVGTIKEVDIIGKVANTKK